MQTGFSSIALILLLAALCSGCRANDVSLEIIEPGVQPKLVLEKGAGEGPAWHPERGLFFSGGNRITRLEKSGKMHVCRMVVHDLPR